VCDAHAFRPAFLLLHTQGRQLIGDAVIVALVQEFKSTSRHILHIDSIIFKTALALFIAFIFSPFIVLLVTLFAPGLRSEAEVRSSRSGSAQVQRRRKSALLPLQRACFCGSY
jgi:hypothetical protein